MTQVSEDSALLFLLCSGDVEVRHHLRDEWILVPTETVPRLVQLPLYDRYPACDGVGWLVLFQGARRWVYSGTDPDRLDLDSLALLWLYAETTDLEGLDYSR